MKLLYLFFKCAVLVVLGNGALLAQSHTFRGRVTDAQTGDPVPFANVALKGKPVGGTTNFEGYYSFRTPKLSDSLIVSYLGYATRTKPIDSTRAEQTLDFQLNPTSSQLAEVIIRRGEDPAYAVMRKVVNAKDQHNWRRLKAYEYESYNKIEFDVDHLSERFKKRGVGKKISGVIDKLDKIAGEDGQPVIPIFLSESISNVYFRRNPEKRKEKIEKTKIEGVGVTNGSLFSQLLGSTFQQYNFYENYLSILQKDFISPIADGWKGSYTYFLSDTVTIGDQVCYEIDVDPKRKQDLAFVGKFWIDTASYALRQVDLAITGDANLNYIERIKIQQELAPVGNPIGDSEIETAWLPIKNRVVLNVAQLSDQSPGMLAKFYTSNQKIVVNQPRDPAFYDVTLELAETYKDYPPTFWQQARHDSLTRDERLAYSLIDSVKSIPVVRTYVEVASILANGYKKIYTGVEFGPFLSSFASNNVEGLRFRAGIRTNTEFSRKWVFNGYLAYGTGDGRFKYGANGQYILSRKPWLVLVAAQSYDLERIGLTSEAVGNNSLFAAYSRFGMYRRGFFQNESFVYFRGEVTKGFTPTIGLRHRTFDPLYPFLYKVRPEDPGSPMANSYDHTELVFEARYARHEVFLLNDNERVSLGNDNRPVLTLRYHLGLRNTLGGDFNYHRFSGQLGQSFRVGALGRSRYVLTGGFTPSTLPYPLLFPHLGNQSAFYVENAYNLMNFYEFISDHYGAVRFEHNFEGLLFNRLPAIRRLKWRLLVNANALWGGVRQANRDMIVERDTQGRLVPGFGSLGSRPYVEVGYGIENILKFFRVQAFHRLTYLNQPPAVDVAPIKRFGIKASAYFTL
ncbi:MAG: DUF5686 and carboxypeptidase regulatory-like domain-containing protein [Cytophagaceae bacterium]|nr:DUF5686 and carboxypeptidase regulatory-like domain-containing protein [Cytophagaceae bacterium]